MYLQYNKNNFKFSKKCLILVNLLKIKFTLLNSGPKVYTVKKGLVDGCD